MSEGLAALEREDYGAARDAFVRAETLVSDSPASRAGREQAEAGLRLSAVTTARAAAETAEAEERWRDAEGQYDAVLKLDAGIRFAQDGKARSRARGELDERLDATLRQPERLAAPTVRAEATTLLGLAAEGTSPGPRLRQQIAALEAQIAAYAAPLTVVLLSDGATEVTLYRVGRLGAFTRHELQLTPGTYTVVGSRRGFRDVRRQLVVAPGAPPAPLSVRCEESIEP